MIATARLVLRVPEPRDRAALHAMWADPLVMADLGPLKDAAASDAAIAKHDAYRHEGLGFRVVERRSDGAMIGFCGLKRGESHLAIHGELEAGWIVASAYWGRGYAFEAMAAMLDWGWANTPDARIVAITSARNVKSQRLMEKLGMRRLADGDYESPTYPPGDPLRASVTYAIDRP